MRYSDNTKKYDDAEYKKSTYDRLVLQIRKDGGHGVTVAEIREYAKEFDVSITEFVIRAIKYYINHEC